MSVDAVYVIPVYDGRECETTRRSPHGVQDGSVLHDAEQLVRSRHVVSDGAFAVSEERIRSPDLADHQVVETQDLYGTLEPQTLVYPRLTEKHVHGVLLQIKIRTLFRTLLSFNTFKRWTRGTHSKKIRI